MSDEEWDRTIGLNLTAIFRVCSATQPLLLAGGGGSIVHIAWSHVKETASAAKKAAVVGLSKQRLLDYVVDRIRANVILVGSVATRMTLDGLEAAGAAEVLGLSF